MRETLEKRCSKVRARLEHVNSMKKVATDLRDTHIGDPPAFDDMNDVLMDGGVSVPPLPPNEQDGHAIDMANQQLELSAPPILDGQATIMSTKAKIFATPIQPVRDPSLRVGVN